MLVVKIDLMLARSRFLYRGSNLVTVNRFMKNFASSSRWLLDRIWQSCGSVNFDVDGRLKCFRSSILSPSPTGSVVSKLSANTEKPAPKKRFIPFVRLCLNIFSFGIFIRFSLNWIVVFCASLYLCIFKGKHFFPSARIRGANKSKRFVSNFGQVYHPHLCMKGVGIVSRLCNTGVYKYITTEHTSYLQEIQLKGFHRPTVRGVGSRCAAACASHCRKKYMKHLIDIH